MARGLSAPRLSDVDRADDPTVPRALGALGLDPDVNNDERTVVENVLADAPDADRDAGGSVGGERRMSAAACGATGCRRDEDLTLVATAYGPRVLCPRHRDEIVTREVER